MIQIKSCSQTGKVGYGLCVVTVYMKIFYQKRDYCLINAYNDENKIILGVIDGNIWSPQLVF